MLGFAADADGSYSISQQTIPGDITILPEESALIFHYRINLDVFDARGEVTASRTLPKQLKIVLHSLDQLTDVQGFADSLACQYPLLADIRRSQLIGAINELKGQGNAARPDTPFTGLARSEATQSMAQKMTQSEVEDFLRTAPQKIHWGDDAERLRTLATLAEIAQIDRNLPQLIGHEPLINTLINGLKTFAVTSLSACIKIISIFERMSYCPHYADFLARFKIDTTLSLFHVEVALRNVADHNLTNDKLNGYLTSQNNLLRLIVSLLFNISENPSAMRKMVNKDILTPLSALFDRRNPDLLMLTLRFIRKIAMVPVNWPAVPYEQIPPTIVQYIFRWGQVTAPEGRAKRVAVSRESLELLHVFSLHSEALGVIKQDAIFEGISTLVDLVELRSPLIRIFYRCSLSGGHDEVFRREKVITMLIVATTLDCNERMVALIILSKLSLDREISLSIARSALFTTENLKGMFVHATSAVGEESRVLLQLIRNIVDSQPDLVRGFDAEIITACGQNAERQEVLLDIFAVANRTKMNSERAKYYTSQQPFVQLMLSVLNTDRALPQLKLECVMFISSIVLYSAAAQALGKLGIVDLLVRLFLKYADDLDMQTQCLFAFFRISCHSETRAALLTHPEVVDAVLRHSISKNAVLNGIANAVVDAIVTFDRQSAERLKLPRFECFNQEWLLAVDSPEGTADEAPK
jgi:hypothetical protein